jgi:hypothetical protein
VSGSVSVQTNIMYLIACLLAAVFLPGRRTGGAAQDMAGRPGPLQQEPPGHAAASGRMARARPAIWARRRGSRR